MRKSVDDESHAYELYGRAGTRLGVVGRVDIPVHAGTLRKVTNFFEWTSSLPAVRLEVADVRGCPLFTMVFSAETRWFTAAVHDGDGKALGEVAKAKGFRKIHFDLRAGGETLATVDADGWSGFDYRIDEGGAPVGRITMSAGDTVVGIPTTSDDFLLELDRSLAEPLRTLVVACAVGMDVSVSSHD